MEANEDSIREKKIRKVLFEHSAAEEPEDHYSSPEDTRQTDWESSLFAEENRIKRQKQS